MKVTLLTIQMPTDNIWGKLQINNFTNTHFRFDIQNGKPVLDTSFFADAIEDPENKHKHLTKDSDLYISIQALLDDYFAKL